MRSKPAIKRVLPVDAVYNHRMVTQLINNVMRDGKKTVARKQVYAALEKVTLPVFLQALENIKPQMEVRARRIGGAAYQVPSPVRGSRQDSLAIRWLIAATSARSSTELRSYAAKLAAEITDAAASTGAAYKKKLDTHRMAEANKAFAHFRW